MTSSKVITLSSVKQLIDLNGNSTNVDITFTAKSLDNSDFYALVVDQRTLDSNTPLEFKLAKGSISANIISDNNVYQNHFLCLKSDKPCQVEVVIDKKEIESVNRNIVEPMSQPNTPRQNNNYVKIPEIKKESKTNWVLIVSLCLIAVGAIAAYYYFFVYRPRLTKTYHSITIPEHAPDPIPISTQSIIPEVASPISKGISSSSFSARLSSLLE